MQKSESMALVLNEDFCLRFYISSYGSKIRIFRLFEYRISSFTKTGPVTLRTAPVSITAK